MYWMADPSAKDGEEKYVSLKPVISFHSNKHYEYTMSAPYARAATIANELIEQITAPERVHMAVVVDTNAKHMLATLEVRFNREKLPNDTRNLQNNLPRLNSLTKVKIIEKETANPTLTGMAQGISGMSLASETEGQQIEIPDYVGPFELPGQVLDEECDGMGDFKVVVKVPGNQVSKFHLQAQMKVCLSIQSSTVSITRILAAIQAISRHFPKPRYHDAEDVKNKKIKERRKVDLQNVIFNNGRPIEFPHEIWYSKHMNVPTPKDALDAATDYAKMISDVLNIGQKEVIRIVVQMEQALLLLQRPSGTGKTHTDNRLAIFVALLGRSTLLTAPSQVATRLIVEQLDRELRHIQRDAQHLAKRFDLIYFESMETSKVRLTTVQEDYAQRIERPGVGNWRLQFWYHFHQMVFDIAFTHAAKFPDEEVHLAKKWIDNFNEIQLRGFLSNGDLAEYLNYFTSRAGHVFTKAANTLIVVSTNNNCHNLRHFRWKPQLAILDEAAFGSEGESIIPLSLFPEKAVLAGDHEQLRPRIPCEPLHDRARQYGLSLFQRLVDSQPLKRLDTNYRMHPIVAQLPGSITYRYDSPFN